MKSLGNSSAPRDPANNPPNPSAPTPSRKRFALTGRSCGYDPATTAARADIADVRLAERIFAPHYAAPMPFTLNTAAQLTAAKDGEAIDQLAAGDTFEVLEITAAHAWGVARPSGLVGFLPLSALNAA